MNTLTLMTRASLAFLWIFTGLTSVFFAPEIGYEILNDFGVSGLDADIAVYVGSILDIFIGLWIAIGRWIKYCCLVQLVFITTYSILLTIIDVSYWLHPFGHLTKNLPIIVLIIIYYAETKRPVAS